MKTFKNIPRVLKKTLSVNEDFQITKFLSKGDSETPSRVLLGAFGGSFQRRGKPSDNPSCCFNTGSRSCRQCSLSPRHPVQVLGSSFALTDPKAMRGPRTPRGSARNPRPLPPPATAAALPPAAAPAAGRPARRRPRANTGAGHRCPRGGGGVAARTAAARAGAPRQRSGTAPPPASTCARRRREESAVSRRGRPHRTAPSTAEPSTARRDPPAMTLAAHLGGTCLVLHRGQHRRHPATLRYLLGLPAEEKPLPAARYLSCFCSSLSFLACGSPAAIFALGGVRHAPLASARPPAPARPAPPHRPRRHSHRGAARRAAAPGA